MASNKEQHELITKRATSNTLKLKVRGQVNLINKLTSQLNAVNISTLIPERIEAVDLKTLKMAIMNANCAVRKLHITYTKLAVDTDTEK